MISKKQMANTFSLEIEEIVLKEKMTYMDAIVFAANSKNIEPEAAAALLNNNVKDKLEAESRDLNLLPKISKLPI
tara:strand:+ start:118 stop:342 length:225 start_codon:yes stop_codon:yes gene_type:complete